MSTCTYADLEHILYEQVLLHDTYLDLLEADPEAQRRWPDGCYPASESFRWVLERWFARSDDQRERWRAQYHDATLRHIESLPFCRATACLARVFGEGHYCTKHNRAICESHCWDAVLAAQAAQDASAELRVLVQHGILKLA